MKVFRVYCRDHWDIFGHVDYSNREAAEQDVRWHREHPTPEDEIGWLEIHEIELTINDSFVPPMTEEEYERRHGGYRLTVMDDDPEDESEV